MLEIFSNVIKKMSMLLLIQVFELLKFYLFFKYLSISLQNASFKKGETLHMPAPA